MVNFQILFLYVEGKFGYDEVKLLSPSRDLIRRGDACIKGEIGDNSIVMVEGEIPEVISFILNSRVNSG